jgi:acetolactate synthase I/II/III large subunit
VVNNNSALGQGLRSVKKLYAGREGQPADLVLFGHVDLARVAEAFRIRGAGVEQPQDIIPTIKSALAAGEPFLVDVVTDPDCNPEPPWMLAP